MLKRLFISLLILSALTSEGIVRLPANIYNLYINTGCQLGVPGVKAIPSADQALQAQSKTGRLFGLTQERFLRLTPASVEKLCLDAVKFENATQYEFSHSYEYIDPDTLSFIGYDKNTLLEKSDSSPPVYSV